MSRYDRAMLAGRYAAQCARKEARAGDHAYSQSDGRSRFQAGVVVDTSMPDAAIRKDAGGACQEYTPFRHPAPSTPGAPVRPDAQAGNPPAAQPGTKYRNEIHREGASAGSLGDVKSWSGVAAAGDPALAHRGCAPAAVTAPIREQCHGSPAAARDTPRDANASLAHGYPLVALCRAMKLPAPVPEYRFCYGRRWRFDYAWVAVQLALEIEGGIWTQGRHTRGQGAMADLEKYSEAAILGWRIVYCTPDDLMTLGLDRVRRALNA